MQELVDQNCALKRKGGGLADSPELSVCEFLARCGCTHREDRPTFPRLHRSGLNCQREAQTAAVTPEGAALPPACTNEPLFRKSANHYLTRWISKQASYLRYLGSGQSINTKNVDKNYTLHFGYHGILYRISPFQNIFANHNRPNIAIPDQGTAPFPETPLTTLLELALSVSIAEYSSR